MNTAEHRDRVLQAIRDFQRSQGRIRKVQRMVGAKQGQKLLWDRENRPSRQNENQGVKHDR
jgi:hypothetical protein